MQTLCIEARKVALETISISEFDDDMGLGDDELPEDGKPAPCRPLLGASAVTLEVSAEVITYNMDYAPEYSPGAIKLTFASLHAHISYDEGDHFCSGAAKCDFNP